MYYIKHGVYLLYNIYANTCVLCMYYTRRAGQRNCLKTKDRRRNGPGTYIHACIYNTNTSLLEGVGGTRRLRVGHVEEG